MRLFFALLLFWSYFTSAQESLAYLGADYQNDTLSDGTVVNQRDESGKKHGLHIYFQESRLSLTFKRKYFLDWQNHDHIIGYYDHGCPVGKWKFVYPKNGWSEGTIHCNQSKNIIEFRGREGMDFKTGIWTYYRKDSTVYSFTKYEFTLRGKIWKQATYAKKGKEEAFQLTMLNIYTKNKKNQTSKTYYDNGQLKEQVYVTPSKTSWKEFYKDGTLKEETFRTEGKRARKMYFSNGKLSSDVIAWYKKGAERVMLSKRYDEKGILLKEETTVGTPKRQWGCGQHYERFF